MITPSVTPSPDLWFPISALNTAEQHIALTAKMELRLLTTYTPTLLAAEQAVSG